MSMSLWLNQMRRHLNALSGTNLMKAVYSILTILFVILFRMNFVICFPLFMGFDLILFGMLFNYTS